MQSTGTKTNDGRLVFIEFEPAVSGFGLKVDDFILRRFDETCLRENPPEDEWGDWFPPPERLTEWELCELTDWVELVALNYDLFPDPDIFPMDGYQVGMEDISTRNVVLETNSQKTLAAIRSTGHVPVKGRGELFIRIDVDAY